MENQNPQPVQPQVPANQAEPPLAAPQPVAPAQAPQAAPSVQAPVVPAQPASFVPPKKSHTGRNIALGCLVIVILMFLGFGWLTYRTYTAFKNKASELGPFGRFMIMMVGLDKGRNLPGTGITLPEKRSEVAEVIEKRAADIKYGTAREVSAPKGGALEIINNDITDLLNKYFGGVKLIDSGGVMSITASSKDDGGTGNVGSLSYVVKDVPSENQCNDIRTFMVERGYEVSICTFSSGFFNPGDSRDLKQYAIITNKKYNDGGKEFDLSIMLGNHVEKDNTEKENNENLFTLLTFYGSK